jgi:hypothetical protein
MLAIQGQRLEIVSVCSSYHILSFIATCRKLGSGSDSAARSPCKVLGRPLRHLDETPCLSFRGQVDRYRERSDVILAEDSPVQVEDSEHCFFVNHEETGACCALYRPLERKLIVVSFRVTSGNMRSH